MDVSALQEANFDTGVAFSGNDNKIISNTNTEEHSVGSVSRCCSPHSHEDTPPYRIIKVFPTLHRRIVVLYTSHLSDNALSTLNKEDSNKKILLRSLVEGRNNKHQSQNLFRECLAVNVSLLPPCSINHYRDTRINDRETRPLSEVREDKDIEDDEDLITREPYLLMTTTVGREKC